MENFGKCLNTKSYQQHVYCYSAPSTISSVSFFLLSGTLQLPQQHASSMMPVYQPARRILHLTCPLRTVCRRICVFYVFPNYCMAIWTCTLLSISAFLLCEEYGGSYGKPLLIFCGCNLQYSLWPFYASHVSQKTTCSSMPWLPVYISSACWKESLPYHTDRKMKLFAFNFPATENLWCFYACIGSSLPYIALLPPYPSPLYSVRFCAYYL